MNRVDEYKRLRRDVCIGARGICEASGMHAPTCDGIGRILHHIWPKSKGGPDHIGNSMWVHPACHMGRIHGRPDEARKAGYLRNNFASLDGWTPGRWEDRFVLDDDREEPSHGKANNPPAVQDVEPF